MSGIYGSENNYITFSDGKKYDLNLLDRLSGKSVKGSVWAQYNSTAKGGNDNDIFDAAEIENIKKDLKKNSQNGKISAQGLNSIFENADAFSSVQAKMSFETLQMNENMLKKFTITAHRDATFVKKPVISEKTDGKTAYLYDFKDYIPKDKEKYQKVTTYVEKNVKDKEKAIAISNMVCSLSEAYGIDPEITVGILKKETGGFVFSDKVLKNPGRKYKGVMQVDKTTIDILYANPKDANNTKLSRYERAIAYDHRHHVKDQTRIDELKKKYKTTEELYNAIQNDVELGLEVGIMAYKGKLSRTKGDTVAAVRQYCAGQYVLSSDTIPARIWPLPQYNSSSGL